MRMWKQLGAKVKKPGCCTLCDKEVYEIKTRWTKGILEGEPRKVGRPTDDVRKLDYTLSDGTVMSLTFCRTCETEAKKPENFPRIWQIVLEAFERELSPEFISAIGNQPRTEVQQNHVNDFVSGLANRSIIGALSA
jgi:hypothetical protein